MARAKELLFFTFSPVEFAIPLEVPIPSKIFWSYFHCSKLLCGRASPNNSYWAIMSEISFYDNCRNSRGLIG